MHKKVIATLLLSALVLSFACGCQNGDAESAGNTTSKAAS